MIDSKTVESFLAFLREADEQQRTAKTDEQYANDATQDILHRLELYDDTYEQTAELAVMLREVRRGRRLAKDAKELAEKVTAWKTDNISAVKSLEQLLGVMRKKEESMKQRFYGERTDILKKEESKTVPLE